MGENGTLVYENERKVLEWFNQFLENASNSFAMSVAYFKKYYNSCCSDLFSLEYKRESKSKEGRLNAIYLEDMQDFKKSSSYSSVLEQLKGSESFLQEALDNNLIAEHVANSIKEMSISELKKLTKEEVCLLLTDSKFLFYYRNGSLKDLLDDKQISDYNVDDSLVPLLKLHRLNNLQVKYAHTARIVYLTDFEIKNLGIKNELVRSILYTSSLFHDVGRFYQGTYYNSYSEGDLKTTENEQVKDHAEAGYYYSLLDMINLNILGSASNEDLIIHSLAAVVVKKHQLANNKLGNYDKMISNLNVSEYIDKYLLDFVVESYKNAEKFEGGLHGRFSKVDSGSAESMRLSFTDSMLDVISVFTGEKNVDQVRDAIYGIFSYESPDLILSKENIEILKSELFGEDRLKIERKLYNGETIFLTPEYNKILRKHYLSKLVDGKKAESRVLNEYIDYLINSDVHGYFAQYDIVSVIDKVMETEGNGEKYNGINVHPDVLKVLRMSMGLVMDMDKLDILIQRAIKRYPGWNPNMITIRTLKKGDDLEIGENESILEVLKNGFQLDIKYTEDGRVIIDDVLAQALNFNVNLNDDLKKSLSLNSDETKFEEGMVVTDEINKILSAPYSSNTVSLPYSIMEMAHPDMMDRFNVEMNLILPSDLRENVFKVDDERKKDYGINKTYSAFPLGKGTSDKRFYWGNAFPAIWWQLDQFITTNMRSMESLRFIKDSRLLDRMSDAYKSEECPKEYHLFIDEMINFSKYFIDVALKSKVNENGDIIFTDDLVEGYSSVVLSDENTMLKIRNEAAIQYSKDRAKKSDVQNRKETAEIELLEMFDDIDVSVQEKGNNFNK